MCTGERTETLGWGVQVHRARTETLGCKVEQKSTNHDKLTIVCNCML